MSERVDVVVIGMGPGGEDVAGNLAEGGLKVVGVEKQLVGGECPYWGCVPSKMMIRAAELLAESRRIPGVFRCLRRHTGLAAGGQADPRRSHRQLERDCSPHVAMYQASIATADILGKAHAAADYRALPRVTFTDPEVGAAGLTEKQAPERGIKVRTGMGSVPRSTRGWIHGLGNEGFHKLVEDADRGVLVGATSMGPRGGEVMSFLELAIQEQIPTDRLRNMIYAYPTFHRGIEDALKDLATS